MFDFLPRICWHLWRALFRRRVALTEPFESRLRVWPLLDTDGFRYFALPRYLAVASIVIWSHALRSGFFRACLKHRWVFVTKRQYAQFFKPIPIFATYTAKTQLVTWNEYAFIRRIEFYRREILCAVTYLELFTLRPGRGKVRTSEVLEKSGLAGTKPQTWPEAIKDWRTSD